MGEPPSHDQTVPFILDTIPSGDDSVPAPPLEGEGFIARYTQVGTIGEGGMGVVQHCRDQRIGRDIALKLAREGALSTRFLREAQVQGRLEHPSIVPVYDLGCTPEGQLYFTMRRVRGETLADILDRQHRGEREAIEGHSRRKLLAAFVNICLTVDFAHARGVLHRDISRRT
jgi:serine/threonine-protein kinase